LVVARRAKPEVRTYDEIKEFRSVDEIDRGIGSLERRIADVNELATNTRYDDRRRYNVESSIASTVLEIFGPNSPEYGELQHHRIWHGPTMINQSEYESQACFLEGIPQTVAMLQGLIDRLREKRSFFTRDSDGRSQSAFEYMDLHPRIASAAADLYRDTHYRQAVLDASIALVNYVKERSRRHDLDGASLMRTVFSVNNPGLRFNDLSDQTDKDEQEGMMHLFEGAVLALRNPRAHALFDESPELALDYIGLLSLLAKRLDGAKR
jgi:uncharacterized protein (TIGR02391 family)